MKLAWTTTVAAAAIALSTGMAFAASTGMQGQSNGTSPGTSTPGYSVGTGSSQQSAGNSNTGTTSPNYDVGNGSAQKSGTSQYSQSGSGSQPSKSR